MAKGWVEEEFPDLGPGILDIMKADAASGGTAGMFLAGSALCRDCETAEGFAMFEKGLGAGNPDCAVAAADRLRRGEGTARDIDR